MWRTDDGLAVADQWAFVLGNMNVAAAATQTTKTIATKRCGEIVFVLFVAANVAARVASKIEARGQTTKR